MYYHLDKNLFCRLPILSIRSEICFDYNVDICRDQPSSERAWFNQELLLATMDCQQYKLNDLATMFGEDHLKNTCSDTATHFS